MDIVAATTAYESWLAGFAPLYPPDLEYKHQQMADPADPFPFFRATYYRWVQHWTATAGDLTAAPEVLAVGDLHVENFGTWRDADGRLCWGVNDFDEIDRQPYTIDLVRLAASVRCAKRTAGMDIKLATACEAVLEGYRDALEKGGTPFVLEEHHAHLRVLAMAEERDPVHFWKKLTALLADRAEEPPNAAKEALYGSLPAAGLRPQFRRRPHVGLGSLGKPRYVALAEYSGGWVAREAKACTPPATAWAAPRGEPAGTLIAEAVRRAARSHDPFYRVVPGWVVRRLGPRCSRIELTHLKHAADTQRLLRAMGAETANIHVGTAEAAPAVRADLARRPRSWLEEAARTLSELIERDWNDWRQARGPGKPAPGA